MYGALVKNVAGRSGTIGLALLSRKAGDCDPAVHMMTDPIFYLASALWDSWADRGMILRSALAAQRKLADAPRRWKLARHPIEAAMASAHRIGWRLSCNASGFVTAGGDTMEFDVCCPRDIQAVAIGDAELWLLQNAVDRSPFLAGFHGTPFLEPLRTLVHCKPKLDWGPKEQGMLCAIAANGLWPQERLHSIGAVDNDKCRLCPFDIGTQRHRAWQCVGTRAYREQYGLPQSAGVDQRQRFLWNVGLLSDPAVWLPRPASACAIIWDVAPTDGLFHGEAYGDGSTFNGTYAATARSGWAVTHSG